MYNKRKQDAGAYAAVHHLDVLRLAREATRRLRNSKCTIAQIKNALYDICEDIALEQVKDPDHARALAAKVFTKIESRCSVIGFILGGKIGTSKQNQVKIQAVTRRTR